MHKFYFVLLLGNLLFLILGIGARNLYSQNNPVANPNAVVLIGNARFTVLTSSIIRMEYSNQTVFEDRASLGVVNRYFSAVPNYASHVTNGFLTIKTESLVLYYNSTIPGPFNNESLQINYLLSNQQQTWVPGTLDTGNLLGTVRTLDGANGTVELNCVNQTNPTMFCTYGVISKDGWVLVDETKRPVMSPDSNWEFWVDSEPSVDDLDWYFFGHGRNYQQALKEFTSISGNVPLPPRYMFGIFFSRYWAYSDFDLRDVIRQYQDHQVPLDVLVTDMDWHETFYKEAAQGQTDQAGQRIGWTGYTWDANLFPNPQEFLDYCKKFKLKNTLNLHPASGVQPHEALYPEMATAMGINPASQIYVPFNITNQNYTVNLFDIMLKPLNKQGIDFWWLDWQQYENTSIPGMNPTFWLNHVFTHNFARWNLETRPTILHRWGGLGNHRYPVGFSGDVIPSWGSLAFQPRFTATSSNVGYSFWSHDIGGHTLPTPGEMYVRWVQWGSFSPIFRPHCTKDAANDRRLWVYPEPLFEIMRDYVTLRSSLTPYLYTQARRTYDSGVAQIVKPLYYEYPDAEEAYDESYLNQYLFGTDFMIAPIVQPRQLASNLSLSTIWMPTLVNNSVSPYWIEWFTGNMIPAQNQIYYGNYTLSEMPVFIKPGSIVSYWPDDVKPLFGAAQNPPNRLGLMVFPDVTGNLYETSTQVYEDAGDTIGYLNGESAWIPVSFTQFGDTTYTLVVGAAVGQYPGMTSQMSYEVKLSFVWPVSTVNVNGNSISYVPENNGTQDGWRYDGDELAVIITIATEYSRSYDLTVDITFVQPLSKVLLSGIKQKIHRAQEVKVLFDYQWGIQTIYQEDYESLVQLSEVSDLMSDDPTVVVTTISSVDQLLQKAIQEISTITYADDDIIAAAISQLTNQS